MVVGEQPHVDSDMDPKSSSFLMLLALIWGPMNLHPGIQRRRTMFKLAPRSDCNSKPELGVKSSQWAASDASVFPFEISGGDDDRV